MTQHTPGPWKIIILDGETWINPKRGSRHEYALIARVHGKHETANARLIAAAPTMLATGKAWLSTLPGDREVSIAEAEAIINFKAAIAKAVEGS